MKTRARVFIQRNRKLAVSMCLHERLGKDSRLSVLGVDGVSLILSSF